MGPYEIVAPIGAGGMGEVYRARDPRIGRDVALKVLPAEFAGHPDRLRRFEQESRAAGMLNHPNLLTVFDVGANNGAPFIVSELLEGQTLRTRLADGPLPLRKTTDYGRQVAAGLAAAHDKNIVHRDLKPENIFITHDGQVKILDFGLAKLLTKPAESLVTAGSTLERGTDPGTVLGTVGYMSPEQVRGQEVDHRSDLFSLGSILYEMVTGRRPFRGASAADTMSAILREDPPEISASAANVPPALERIIRHCLEKDAAQRFQSARDLAFDLESATGSGSAAGLSAPTSRRAGHLLVPLITLAAGVAIGAAIMKAREKPLPAAPTLRLLTFSGRDLSPSISPDGRTMAFVSTRDGRYRIWLKDLTRGGEVPLTEGEDSWPRFSPDGTSILFIRKETATLSSVWRTAVLGGTPRRLSSNATSADWSNDGRSIVFTRQGGTPESNTTELYLTTADGSGETLLRKIARNFLFPRFSPDGRWIALTDLLPGNTTGKIIRVSSDGKELQEIGATGYSNPGISSVAWTGNDHFLYASPQRQTFFTNFGTQFVLADSRTRTGRPLLQTLATVGTVEVPADGQVIFDAIQLRQHLREIASDGRGEGGRTLTRNTAIDRQPAYSPDGSRLIFMSSRTGNLDLWSIALTDGSLTRLTDDAGEDYDPAYTPDGKHVLWSSNRTGHFEIWMAEPDGSGARQISNDGVDAENATATRDGWIIYNSYSAAKAGLWKIRMDGSEATHLVKGSTELPEVSPDGQYVSYHRMFPRSQLNVIRLSDGRIFEVADVRGNLVLGGFGRSRWTADGSSIAWTDSDDRNHMGLLIQTFRPGADTSATRRQLVGFESDLRVESFAFSPDGRRLTLSVLEQVDTIYHAEGVTGVTKPRRDNSGH